MQFTIKNEQTEIQEMGWICNKVKSFAYVASQYLYLQIEIIYKVKIFRTIIQKLELLLHCNGHKLGNGSQ